jgi:hypothetical protein
MGIIARTRQINLDKIRPGHLLRINYTGSDGDSLILVIDPNNQGGARDPGKLHALKLDNLAESKMEDVIKFINKTIPRNRDNVNTDELYKTLKSSGYSVLGKTSYRTYFHEKLTNYRRIQLGQSMDPTTKRYIVGKSVLYGVEHGSHVLVNSNDYDEFVQQLNNINNKTYYEGTNGHEDVTISLLNILLGTTDYISKSESWEPSRVPNLYVTELYGSEADALWDALTKKIEEENINIKGKTLLDILAITSGKTGKNWWSEKKMTRSQIIKSVESATQGREDVPDLQYSYLLNESFESITFDKFKQFKDEMMKVAFATDYAGEWGGDPYIGNMLERTMSRVQYLRDMNLLKLMRSRPGVYFAGHSHVDLVKDLVTKGK